MGTIALSANTLDFIVHYSRAEPFRSITSVDPICLPGIIDDLREANAWGISRFRRPQYLQQRREIESLLRSTFIEAGGQPRVEHPIYFFLGRNSKFEQNEKNIGYLIYLRDLDPRAVSFTYGDSMLSFNDENRRLAGAEYFNPLCQKVFTTTDVAALFQNRHPIGQDPLHIEAQLWAMPEPAVVTVLAR
jgi:hypothetical protein